MSFWSNILQGARGFPGINMMTPNVTHLGAEEALSLLNPENMTAGRMWASQPHFRTVVTFVARNVAQLGLHTFSRVGETDRKRDRTSPLARAIAYPDGTMTTFDMVFALVGDLLLYDRAYWWAAPSADTPHGFMLRRLPPTWVQPVMENPWEVKHYLAYVRKDGSPVKLPPEHVLAFPGYAPGSMYGSSPTVDALRDTLREQIESSKYRGQIWKRGGRVSSVLQRPLDAPEWSDKARESFREDWYQKYTGQGTLAGGTPLLEDGMTLQRVDFTAQEQQFVEAAKLSLVTVASAFHVNPTMIGQNEGANYANVKEFRKMLYGDTLGPTIARIEGRINTFLVPKMDQDPAVTYTEFNIEEKMQGDFEEQATAFQSAAGAPYMTRNEVRAMRNRPALPGGDALVVPLNVLEGGQASPQDSGSQNRNAAPGRQVKAAPVPDTYDQRAQAILQDFFKRQGSAVKAKVGAGADWWDGERWDDELTTEVFRVANLVSSYVGQNTVRSLGYDPEEYDVEQTLNFLKAVSRRTAEGMNIATHDQVAAAIADPGEDTTAVQAVGHVFDVAHESRSLQSAATIGTAAAGFAVLEAAKQTGTGSMKRWQVNSGNPRASHAAMDGETVPVNELFSNGMMWPGSVEGNVEEVAGCQCSLVLITE